MVLVMQALSGAGWLEVDASACNANTDSKKAAWDKPMKQRIATFRGNSSHAEWGIQPSGGGSAVGRTTQHRAFLAQTLRQFSICRLLDSPCGDMTWMPSVSMPNGLEYYGGDVSVALVSFNEERLADDPRFTRRFRQFDMTCEVARLTGCALIHCKDALFHLSSADALRALQAFDSSGAGYLVTTTFNSSSVLSNSYTPRKHGDRAYRDNVTWVGHARHSTMCARTVLLTRCAHRHRPRVMTRLASRKSTCAAHPFASHRTSSDLVCAPAANMPLLSMDCGSFRPSVRARASTELLRHGRMAVDSQN